MTMLLAHLKLLVCFISICFFLSLKNSLFSTIYQRALIAHLKPIVRFLLIYCTQRLKNYFNSKYCILKWSYKIIFTESQLCDRNFLAKVNYSTHEHS